MRILPNTLTGFLWRYAIRYKFCILGFCLVGFSWAGYASLTSYTMKLIIDRVSKAPEDGHLMQAVLWPVILYVSLGAFLGVTFRFYDWLLLKTFPVMKNEMTAEMFDYVEGHSYSYFQDNFAGSLGNKINDMAKNSVMVISELIDHFFARALSIIIGAITMYMVHPYFAWVLVIWSIIFIVSSAFLSKKAQQYSEVFSEARSTVVGKIVDSIGNILNVKLFAREDYENRYLGTYLDDMAVKDRKVGWYLLKVKTFYAVSITALTAIMMWLLIEERSQGNITVGDFALILTLNMFMIEEVFFVANQLLPFSEKVGTCQQALSIISPRHGVVDLPTAATLKVTRGEIIFDRVHFQYKKGESIFADKSITINPGERVGLVGFSGSGKSTFVNLILRFFDVSSGKIMIDSQDIKEVTQESLRSQIAMIPQDPLLFHRSLAANIGYGSLGASFDQIVEASKQAHCHEFIEKMALGYDTLVGERGVKLSGGQRQRVAIARAILKNAPILILDEATSSLDSVTENYIQMSLMKLMEERTTIVIAHRLSTLFHMDRILVFSEGQVIEDGTHAELLAQNGHYAILWNMQAGGFIGDPGLSNGSD